MIIKMEVLASGGECSISNKDMTDIIRYQFRIKESPNSILLVFTNKNQAEAKEEGEHRVRFQKTHYRSKDRFPQEVNRDKIHIEVTKFLLSRWK